MSLFRSIARNTIVQLGGKIASTVLGLAAIAMMTRYLGREGFGGYSTIVAFLQFFGIIVDFGLTITTVQMISEPNADERKIVSNIFTLRFFSSLIFLGLAPVAVLFFPYAPAVKLGVLVTTLSFFFISLHQVFVGVFQKRLRMEKIALAEIIGRLALIAGIFFAIRGGGGLVWVMGAVVFGSFANWFSTLLFLRRLIRLSWAFDFGIWKNILRRSWPIGVSIIFNLVYLKADTLLLSLIKTQEDVGLYGAAYRVIDILTMIPIMIVGVVLPILTSAWVSGDREKFKNILSVAFGGLSMIALPIIVGTFFVARPLMAFVAGEDFALSGDILTILVLAAGAVFYGSLFGHMVVAVGKQRPMVWGYCATALLTIAGYFIFIPRYSYYGAAWMTVFSEVFMGLLVFAMVFRTTRISPSLDKFWRALGASAIMAVALFLLPEAHVLITLSVGVGVYAAALYFFKGFDKRILKEVFWSEPLE